MTSQLWLSIGLGGVLGVLYYAASLWTHRRAMRSRRRRFMLVFLGGMAVRMTVVLASIVLIVVLLPVREHAFLGTFIVVFVCGVVLEVARLYRHGSY